MFDHTRRRRTALVVVAATVAVAAALTAALGSAGAAQRSAGNAFGPGSFEITNPYLPVSNFHRCVLRGDDQGQQLRIVRVLKLRTKTFEYKGQKVEAAVVKDSVTDVKADRLIEQTIDYFAQDKAGTVFYFGEDVNEFTPGQPVSHEGQWRLGRDTNKPGVLMPAHPQVGDKFKSEAVPRIAVEKDEVVAAGKTQTVYGQTYRHVIKIREHATTPKPAEFESKTYAPGVGVITEANGGVGLVGCS
jgi:hypothetical protein